MSQKMMQDYVLNMQSVLQNLMQELKKMIATVKKQTNKLEEEQQ